MLALWYPVSVFGYGSLLNAVSVNPFGSLEGFVSIRTDGSLEDLVSIRWIGSLASRVSIRWFGSLYPDVSVAHDGSLKGYVSVPRSGPLMVRVSVTSQGLINAKLRQQRSPSIDILVARAAEVLNERQPSQDLRLGRLNRFAPAAVNFLLGAHGLACHWRQVAFARVAMLISPQCQLPGVFSWP